MTEENSIAKLDRWYTAEEKGTPNSNPNSDERNHRKTHIQSASNMHTTPCQQLSLHAGHQGWTIQPCLRYKMLMVMLTRETDKIRNGNWEELLNKTAEKYKESKEFWEMIKKKIKGDNTQRL